MVSAAIDKNATSTKITGLAADTIYYFRVRASRGKHSRIAGFRLVIALMARVISLVASWDNGLPQSIVRIFQPASV